MGIEMKPFRPMLAAKTPEDLRDLFNGHARVLGSYKLDGIRAIVRNGILVSRTLKPIPSEFAQRLIRNIDAMEGLDGELLVPKQHGPTIYHDTYSAVMTHGSMEPVIFWVFDHVSDGPYMNRQERIRRALHSYYGSEPIRILEQRPLDYVGAVEDMEAEASDLEYEGLIVRDPMAPYKFGRSTSKEQYLVKIKRTQDSEALVVGFEELMHNRNVAVQSKLERSSHQANKEASGMLGALVVREVGIPGDFRIGTGLGLDMSLRKEIWSNQQKYIGRIVKYRFLPYGTQELPRHPVFLGWRSPEDM